MYGQQPYLMAQPVYQPPSSTRKIPKSVVAPQSIAPSQRKALVTKAERGELTPPMAQFAEQVYGPGRNLSTFAQAYQGPYPMPARTAGATTAAGRNLSFTAPQLVSQGQKKALLTKARRQEVTPEMAQFAQQVYGPQIAAQQGGIPYVSSRPAAPAVAPAARFQTPAVAPARFQTLAAPLGMFQPLPMAAGAAPRVPLSVIAPQAVSLSAKKGLVTKARLGEQLTPQMQQYALNQLAPQVAAEQRLTTTRPSSLARTRAPPALPLGQAAYFQNDDFLNQEDMGQRYNQGYGFAHGSLGRAAYFQNNDCSNQEDMEQGYGYEQEYY